MVHTMPRVVFRLAAVLVVFQHGFDDRSSQGIEVVHRRHQITKDCGAEDIESFGTVPHVWVQG